MSRRTRNDERKLIEDYQARVAREAKNLALDSRAAENQGNDRLSELLAEAAYGFAREAEHIRLQLRR